MLYSNASAHIDILIVGAITGSRSYNRYVPPMVIFTVSIGTLLLLGLLCIALALVLQQEEEPVTMRRSLPSAPEQAKPPVPGMFVVH